MREADVKATSARNPTERKFSRFVEAVGFTEAVGRGLLPLQRNVAGALTDPVSGLSPQLFLRQPFRAAPHVYPLQLKFLPTLFYSLRIIVSALVPFLRS